MTEIRTIPGGTAKWTRDATANDSDKSTTVPAGKQWQILLIVGYLTTSADVGNRNLLVTISNGTDLVWTSYKGANIAASSRGNLTISQGLTAYASTGSRAPIDSLTAAVSCTSDSFIGILPAGYVIRVYDVAAVAAGADDLVVILHYIEYDA